MFVVLGEVQGETWLTMGRHSEYSIQEKPVTLGKVGREVAHLLLTGASIRAIADKRNVCIGTIKYHATRILKLYGVTNRIEYMAKFIKEEIHETET